MNLFSNVDLVNSFIINSILNFFICIGFMILSFFLIKIIYRNNILKNQLVKYKFLNNIVTVILGAIVGLPALLYIDNLQWSLTLYIIAIAALSFIFNHYLFLGSSTLLITVSLLIFFNDKSNQLNNYYFILNICLIIITYLLLLGLKYLPWKNNIIFIIFLLLQILINVTISFPIVLTDVFKKISNNFDYFSFCISFLIYTILSIAIFSILKIANRFISKNDNLSLKLNVVNNFIYGPNLKTAINDFIKQHHVNYAIIAKFNLQGFDNLMTQYGASYVNKLRTQSLKILNDKLKEFECINYLLNDDQYFSLIKLNNIDDLNLSSVLKGNELFERHENDPLYFLENLIKEVIEKLKQEHIYISINSWCCIYGIQSNDIDFINNNLQNLYNIKFSSLKNSVLLLQNLTSQNAKQKSKNEILNEIGIFSPNSIAINFSEIIFSNKHYFSINASSIIPFLVNKFEIWNVIDNELIKSVIMCHTSALGIKEFIQKGYQNEINHILLIDYPQYLLEQNNFNLFDLMAKISSYGLVKEQYCLCIRFYHNIFTSEFLENVNTLIKNNISFIFKHNYQKITNKQIKNYISKYQELAREIN